MMKSSHPLLASLALLLAPACATDDPAPIDETDVEDADGDGDGSADGDGSGDSTDPVQPGAPAGSLDATFGTGGIKSLTELGQGYASSLVTQGDKLLACATSVDGANWVIRIARFHATGELDTSFATNGIREIVQPNYNTTCRGLAVRADGSFLMSGRVLGLGVDAVHHISADGKTLLDDTIFDNIKISKISPTENAQQLFVVGIREAVDVQKVYRYSASASSDSIITGMGGTITRAFDAGGTSIAIGAFDQSGLSSWQMLVADQQTGALVPLGVDARVLGGPSDFLKEAVALPDGSFFAVGSANSDLEVKVARFVPGDAPTATSEQHAHGSGPSTAYSVTVDGEDRPIVVGTAVVDGTSTFGWQRYEAASTTLDKTYQSGGLASAAAPSGHAELNATAYLDGAIYALGTYDVETPSPKLALVRITE